MIFTTKQEEGIKTALARFRSGEKYTYIAGFAGTGKTTIAKYIIEQTKVDPSRVAYAAYTGKAAQVLRSCGCDNAMTTHRLLYESSRLPGGGYVNTPRLSLDYDIVVIDEVSMMPKEMWSLLLDFPVYVIALGDPFQLPPIAAESGIPTTEKPHVFLDEIMRQEEDSHIVQISKMLREEKLPTYCNYPDLKIIPRKMLNDNLLLHADQVLCGRNVTRTEINARIRELKFSKLATDLPVTGEKLICLENCAERVNGNGDILVNGEVGEISDIVFRDTVYLKPSMKFTFTPENGFPFFGVQADYDYLQDHDHTFAPVIFRKLIKLRMLPLKFDFGYCITVHKAQGSQADNILLFDEMLPGCNYYRWLYTACTRAKKKLIICTD